MFRIKVKHYNRYACTINMKFLFLTNFNIDFFDNRSFVYIEPHDVLIVSKEI